MQKSKEYQNNDQKMYHEKKKHELENIKKAQGDLAKNAVLTSPKIKVLSISNYYICFIINLYKHFFLLDYIIF